MPLINHGEMKQGRIRELEEFHRFLEVLSSWLALTDDAFVGELRQQLHRATAPVSSKTLNDPQGACQTCCQLVDLRLQR